jgi:hypothetical protein
MESSTRTAVMRIMTDSKSKRKSGRSFGSTRRMRKFKARNP